MSRLGLRDPYYRFLRIIELLYDLDIDFSNSNLLDLGCHGGQFIELMQNEFGIMATGIDGWDKEIKDDDTWEYHKIDLNKGFILEKKFDIISALEVIEHIIDTDTFLECCYKHLSEEGILIISTPNINSLRNRIRVPLGLYPFGLEYNNIIHHVRLYNLNNLIKHLKEYKFEIVKSCGVNLIPIKYLNKQYLVNISDKLSNIFPYLSNNIIVIAKKC